MSVRVEGGVRHEQIYVMLIKFSSHHENALRLNPPIGLNQRSDAFCTINRIIIVFLLVCGMVATKKYREREVSFPSQPSFSLKDLLHSF